APVADAAARLIPMEVTVPNPGGNIRSGLMARVFVDANGQDTVMIPEGAIALADNTSAVDAATDTTTDTATNAAVVFVPTQAGDGLSVTARPVSLGQRDNGRVEIVSGLALGERYVINSDGALTDGQSVRRSFLSEE
ncbi:MAG: efflux transporter periplasmic adaptor subunit, partial [Cyanobacteria bacterium P01_H01_bin.130]